MPEIKGSTAHTPEEPPTPPKESTASHKVMKPLPAVDTASRFGYQAVTENLLEMKAKVVRSRTAHPDKEFICDDATYKLLMAHLALLLSNAETYDTGLFLIGPKAKDAQNPQYERNERLLTITVHELSLLATELAARKKISPSQAYKLLLGAIDRYDDENPRKSSSSFLLRSALLLASSGAGANLESWMVYTRSGKPDRAHIWEFLDELKNWTAEAQGAMAKESELLIVEARGLALQHPENKVLLLKGGFGAGKTSLAKKLLKESFSGVIAPDKAKMAVRRSLPDVSHNVAHVQGSQLAYNLFDELIKQQSGTCAYDSSLKAPGDVAAYLKKCQKVHKKMEIFDVARKDVARFLSVLKRDVDGEDPRIPPEIMMKAAIGDKLNRVACMEVILKSESKENASRPVYHFLCGNAQGTDTKEVLTLGPNNEMQLASEAKERLKLEGIEVDDTKGEIRLVMDEATLTKEYHEQFQTAVAALVDTLSDDERMALRDCFSKRVFYLREAVAEIRSSSQLYQHLPQKVQEALPNKVFVEAFNSMPEPIQEQIFRTCEQTGRFSYLDLSLQAALQIHSKLLQDPWK